MRWQWVLLPFWRSPMNPILKAFPNAKQSLMKLKKSKLFLDENSRFPLYHFENCHSIDPDKIIHIYWLYQKFDGEIWHFFTHYRWLQHLRSVCCSWCKHQHEKYRDFLHTDISQFTQLGFELMWSISFLVLVSFQSKQVHAHY